MATKSTRVMWDGRASVEVLLENKEVYHWAKGAMDFLLALMLLVLLSPLLLLVALLIKLDSRGSILFKQERMGYSWRDRERKPFMMYKFRSMYQDCDQNVHKEYVSKWINGDLETEQGIAKLVNDDRVTRVGRILRKTSLDELPQLWNVLRGDMSLVGPRPVPLYEVDGYEPWHRQRLDATPGVTGLWQLKGRGLVTVDEMARLDIEYIACQSLWFDVKIMLLTVPAMLSGRGAA